MLHVKWQQKVFAPAAKVFAPHISECDDHLHLIYLIVMGRKHAHEP